MKPPAWLWVLLAVPAAVLVNMAPQDGQAAPRVPVGPDRDRFALRCHRLVEARLVAPGTARFPSPWDGDITGEGGHLTYASTVDAQNSFGALIRTPFRCDLSTDGTVTLTMP